MKEKFERKELIEIHRGILQKLARRQAQQRTNRLQHLRQRRISLQVQIAELKQKQTSGGLVSHDEFFGLERPYLRVWHPIVVISNETKEPIPLSQILQQVRHQRTLTASYRLAGISLLPCVSKEVLALRFDISWQGRFVACYHCFFDAVSTSARRRRGPAPELYLRLVQHTLPRAIPLARIWQKHMGGMVFVGPLLQPDQWRVDWMEPFRAFAQELYRACHHDWVHQQIISGIREHWDPSIVATKREDDTQQITFHILSRLRVRLNFQAMADRPSAIAVRWVHPRKQRKQPQATLQPSRHCFDMLPISDDEDEENDDNRKLQQPNGGDEEVNQEDVLKQAKEFFRQSAVLEAIPQVSKLISS